jgi:uncharacterized protein (DUF2141 family)
MGNVWRLAVFGTTFFWLLLVLVVELIPAHAGELGTLTIRVDTVSPAGGVLRLGLYDAGTYPDNDSTPVASADVTARTGEMVIVLRGIPPGVYAVETFQDVNANGKMDTTWLGIPEEPYGFSHDAKTFLSRPDFKAVSFHVGEGENEQTLHLQNSVSLVAAKDKPRRQIAGF